MANRRCFNTLNRHCTSLLSSNASCQFLKSLPLIDAIAQSDSFAIGDSTSNIPLIRRNFESLSCFQSESVRHFSSRRRNPGEQDEENGDSDDYEDDDENEDDEEEEDEDDDEEGEIGENIDGDGDHTSRPVSNCVVNREYSTEEKEKEANAIGYKVIGPLDPSERPFKPWEPVFAVVQIGSHQFKVSNGDVIYTERLKYCEVNDKLILNRVLMIGSSNQTIIGRPILPDAAVHAVVEEHALDAKVIIFKKKRRKNYRRTKGHRQELTSLRITDIQGIEKPAKVAVRKPEKEAVAA